MKKLSFLLIIFALIMCFASCGDNNIYIGIPDVGGSTTTKDAETTDESSKDAQTSDDTKTDTETSTDTDTSTDNGTSSADTTTDTESSKDDPSTDTEQSSDTQEQPDESKDDGKNDPTPPTPPEPSGYDYDIIYDLNGGHFESDVPDGYYTSDGAEIDIKPVRAGYKFYGWININSGECVDKIIISQGSEKNLEFYAIWYTDIDANGFVLRNDGETYTLVWYQGTKINVVNIPDSFNSLPITKIDSYAFYYRKDIERVSIPLSINELGKYVFEKSIGMVLNLKNQKELNSWLEKLVYDETNIQAIEVIKGERAAIGFSKWM